MDLQSINPATGKLLERFAAFSDAQIEAALHKSHAAWLNWRAQPVEGRAALMLRLADLLEAQVEGLARIITLEMGKLTREARAEIKKCAWVCRYYGEQGPEFLKDEIIATEATKTYVSYPPLGPVLAIMPWNFPFWQLFRFAVPALTAGNTVLLKHAASVPQCALAIETLFHEAGFPEGVFQALLIKAGQVARVIADPRVQAVTLTGSNTAGAKIGAQAAAAIKKSVLELGGSDPFVVLEDADLHQAAQVAVQARFQNAGQSCIAAKRFVLVESIAGSFIEWLKAEVEQLTLGDPLRVDTTLAPLARGDLREDLHAQVQDALDKGATAITGCAPIEGEGYFYRPSILSEVQPTMRAYHEELFGPVAIILRARDEQDALRLANDTPFGLGGSVWTQDLERGERFARALHCGLAFVNEMVKSDPRMPFGGVKHSGYGRELGWYGIHEFVNIKTVWVK